MRQEDITIKEYLREKGIEFREHNGELITRCIFDDCDKDSRPGEAHLYFNIATGQYDCKKCGAQGNLITLAKHFGDELYDSMPTQEVEQKSTTKIDQTLIENYHSQLSDRIRVWLNARGLTNDTIAQNKIGYGEFYGKNWITIPISNQEGTPLFLKLRKDPDDTSNPDKFRFYPKGSKATLYGLENLKNNTDMIVICEGEFDRLILQANGIPAITSTGGAGTFKDEWVELFKDVQNIYLCFDTDEAGQKGMRKTASLLAERLPDSRIFEIHLPDRMTDGKDVTDYFVKYNGNVDEFMSFASQVAGPRNIDTSEFKPLNGADIASILGLTIKKDDENKIVAFLCCLSAYTENGQFNISFNAPSSTGKSYIPTEVARLFPIADVKEIGYCSSQAFYHDTGIYNAEKKGYEIDLSRKILIFLDQPHSALLERLRPILSHDKKEIQSKITDKSQRGGLKTKNVFIKGYPSVIFCSAGLRIDEQEGTRFFLLSPETNQEKIRDSIHERIIKESDNEAYRAWLESNIDRKMLKDRVEAIKQAHIDDVKIPNPEQIEQIFRSKREILKPRHQRDIGRLISIIKTFALLNLWFRERQGDIVIANESDVAEAVKIWDAISESQEYNLPPYIYNLYQEVIVPAWWEKNATQISAENVGVSRQEIIKKHFEVYGRSLDDWRLRQQIIPMLEACGLITQDPDPNDKRKILISPTTQLTNSPDQTNSE